MVGSASRASAAQPAGHARKRGAQPRRAGARRPRRWSRAGRRAESGRAPPTRPAGDRSGAPGPRAGGTRRARAKSSAISGSSVAMPRPTRSVRSSASSTSRGVSVSSARSKPGSTSASSGNSRSSARQKASIVEIAMSVRLSRISRHSSGAIVCVAVALRQLLQNALPHLGGGLARERDREDVARLDAGQRAGRRSDRPARASCRCRPTPRARRCASDRPPARAPRRRAPRADRRRRSRTAAARQSRRLAGSRVRASTASTISSRQTARYGARPAQRLLRRPRREAPARRCRRARRAVDPARRPSARRSSRPSRCSGTTALSPSNERYIASAIVHAPPRARAQRLARARSCRSAAAAPASGRACSSTCSR